MLEKFVPARIEKGDVYLVRQTFYASGVAVRAGTRLRIDWVTDRVEERIFELSIGLTPIDPPGGTIIWVRSHPLEQYYVDQTLERA